MLIPGSDQNTCAAQWKRSRAVVPGEVRGWRLIVKFRSGAESFSAFLLLFILYSTSAPARSSSPRGGTFWRSAASRRSILLAKKSFLRSEDHTSELQPLTNL